MSKKGGEREGEEGEVGSAGKLAFSLNEKRKTKAKNGKQKRSKMQTINENQAKREMN
jgi:hypothetical protein